MPIPLVFQMHHLPGIDALRLTPNTADTGSIPSSVGLLIGGSP